MVIPEDTPAPLTAGRLASVRRQAGAALFPDGRELPVQSDHWDTWAEGLNNTDDQIAELKARLRGRTPRLPRLARRAHDLLTPRLRPASRRTKAD